MTRAKIEVMDIDLLQLTAVARLLELEDIPESSETSPSSTIEIGSAK